MDGAEDSRRRRWSWISGTFGKVGGLTATVCTVIGTLLALGVLHPFGGSDSVAEAAVKTIDEGSSRASCSVASGTTGFAFTGLFDYRLDRGTVDYDFSKLFVTSGGTFPSRLRTFVDGDVIYYQRPVRAAPKRWIALNSADLYGTDVGPILAYTGDPAGLLTALKLGGQLKRGGQQALASGPATEYSGDLDLARLAQSAPASMRASLQAAVAGLQHRGWSVRWPAEVWVGGDGLVSQLSTQLRIGAAALTRTCSFYDYGAAFTAAPPPADQVSITSPHRFFTALGASPTSVPPALTLLLQSNSLPFTG